MSPCSSTLEEQLSSIMDVLAKAAVSEISQLFSATLRFQITRSLKESDATRTKVMRRELKEKEATRMKVMRRELKEKEATRMKVMRRELFALRLQNRRNASRAAGRLALARDNICRPRTEPLGNGEWTSGWDGWTTGRHKRSGGTVTFVVIGKSYNNNQD